MEKPKLEFREEHAAGSGLYFRIDELLYSGRSSYQDILVFRNDFWGVVFVLDGLVMMTERDEHFYHEALVHPAMLTAERTDSVLLIGGGDGGSVREILRYSPKGVTVAEIDGEVIEVAKRYLPTGRYLTHPNVELEITDGAKKVKEGKLWDVVIVDSTDPVGPAKVLFSEEFLRDVARSLSEGGVMSMQVGSPTFYADQIEETHRLLKGLFPYVRFYVSFTPTYPSGMWGFFLAGRTPLEPKRSAPKGCRLIKNSETVDALFRLGEAFV